MMAIKSNEKLWAWTDKGSLQERADRLASGVEESAWVRCSCREWRQRTAGLRLGCRGNTAPAGSGQGPLAADCRAAWPSHEDLAYYVCSARREHPGGTGRPGGRNPVGHRDVSRRPRERSAGPVRGAAVGRLVPAHHLAMLADAGVHAYSGGGTAAKHRRRAVANLGEKGAALSRKSSAR